MSPSKAAASSEVIADWPEESREAAQLEATAMRGCEEAERRWKWVRTKVKESSPQVRRGIARDGADMPSSRVVVLALTVLAAHGCGLSKSGSNAIHADPDTRIGAGAELTPRACMPARQVRASD